MKSELIAASDALQAMKLERENKIVSFTHPKP